MQISPVRLIFAILLLGLLLDPNLAEAAEAEIDPPKPSSIDPSKMCHKGITMDGRPNRLSSIAGLSAIRQWTQAAMKYGDNYSMWHNAQGSKVKCEKFARSDYFKCTASGKPCRVMHLNQTAW